MNPVSRTLPLRWVYPSIGAAVACVGGGLLYAVHADPLLIAIVATVLCIVTGWLLGQRWDTLRETASTGTPLTLLFVDVDHLKTINDQLGHASGDAALRLVGQCLTQTCRSRDVVARWGGDEFAILALWTTSREGMILAHRIRETLAHMARQAGTLACPTVSIGVAELAQVGSSRPDALLHAADDALYAAKMGGRDRVCLNVPEARPRRRRARLANMRTRPLRLQDPVSPTKH